MRNALILHGMPSREEYFDPEAPSPSHRHWLPWLQRQLLLAGVLTQTPELPKPYEPVYEAWRDVVERFEITEETMLVGHSCGAGFLVRWLSESSRRAGRVALVAPWLDPLHELETGFFDYSIDARLVERTDVVVVLVSRDDNDEILASVATLRDSLPGIELIELDGFGHFTDSNMTTNALPELLAALLVV